MKEKETYISCGMVIKNARLKKEKSVSDLAFEIAKNKENTKLYIKKINMWEKEKDYPNLDEIYLLAYALEINPTDLMILRDRHRKNFVKSGKTKKKKKKLVDWEEVSLELKAYFSAGAQLFIIFALFFLCVQVVRLERAFMGPDNYGEQVDGYITDYMDDYENTYGGNESAAEDLETPEEEVSNNTTNIVN